MKIGASITSLLDNDQQDNSTSTVPAVAPTAADAPTARDQVDPNKKTKKDNNRNKKKKDRSNPTVLKSPLLRLNDPLELNRNIDTWSGG
jgi:hypothetical protein